MEAEVSSHSMRQGAAKQLPPDVHISLFVGAILNETNFLVPGTGMLWIGVDNFSLGHQFLDRFVYACRQIGPIIIRLTAGQQDQLFFLQRIGTDAVGRFADIVCLFCLL